MNRRKFMKTTLLIAPLSLLSENQRRARRKINFRGHIVINGKKVQSINDVKVNANSKIEVKGNDSFVQFKIKDDAFKISKDANIQFKGKKHVSNIKVKKGRLLAVFKTGRDRKIATHNATMGIRGTAVFIETISKSETKFCTCYGKTTVSDKSNKNSARELEATHHKSVQIMDGKVENTNLFYGLGQILLEPTHSDNELRDLEAMVGRIPAFDKNGKRPFIEL